MLNPLRNRPYRRPSRLRHRETLNSSARLASPVRKISSSFNLFTTDGAFALVTSAKAYATFIHRRCVCAHGVREYFSIPRKRHRPIWVSVWKNISAFTGIFISHRGRIRGWKASSFKIPPRLTTIGTSESPPNVMRPIPKRAS